MKFGLLGRRLGHSYSPMIHSMIGSSPYDLYEKEPEDLEDFLRNGDFDGLNVTMPYKKDVIEYLDEIDPLALRLGAVNTIVKRNGRLKGYNSDYFGFRSMVARTGLNVTGKKALVLGSGGASATARAALEDLGAQALVISRRGENNYDNLALHADAALLVNATPLGMYPNTGAAAVDVAQFPHLEGVLDVVYNPARTQLLLDCERLGTPCWNGLWMLVSQAVQSARWFLDRELPDSLVADIHRRLRNQMENVVLIGMPGCGKSSIGRLLAKETGMRFVDADAEIELLAGKSIPEIFAGEGEAAFRAMETAVLADVARGSGLVIATGGGVVTRPENRFHLRQNSHVIFLRQDNVDALPTDGRPLSHSRSLQELAAERLPLYRSWCDLTVEACGVEETVAQIRKELGV